MRGLILKDLMNLRKQGKTYLLIIAVWVLVAVLNKSAGFFGGVMMILPAMVTLSTQGFDEKARWDRYALTMPVSRRDVVRSKYALMLAVAVAGAVLSEVVSLLITRNVQESLVNTALFLSLGVLLASAALPPVLRYGVEQGRVVLILVALIPMTLILLLSRLGMQLPDEETVKRLLFLLPLIAAAAAALSYALSLRIYLKKEF